MGSGVLSGFGPARNPWHLDYSPSGSSSGSGASLAAYMVPLSIGTDTGGSIRGPAAANGIVGLKQTYGRVSRYGVTTLSWTLDHAGPMTKTVADAAHMLAVIAGPDPKDNSTVDESVPDYRRALDGDVRGLRIGVPSNYFFEGASAEVDQGVRAAIQTLVDMGAPAGRSRSSQCEPCRLGRLDGRHGRGGLFPMKKEYAKHRNCSIRWFAKGWRRVSSTPRRTTSKPCVSGPF